MTKDVRYITEGALSFVGEGDTTTAVLTPTKNFAVTYPDQSDPKHVEEVHYTILVRDDDGKGGSISEAVLLLRSQEFRVEVGPTLRRQLLLAASRGSSQRLVVKMEDKVPVVIGVSRKV